MKKLICLLLVLLLLCGCTHTPTETQPALTEPIVTEPAATQAPWIPYNGTSKGYVYYHKEGRDRNWEEDILYFGNSYLKNFHSLTHFASRIELIDDVEYSDEFYNPELRQTFIDMINALIPQIPQLSDMQILYELQRIVALLKDAHTSLDIPINELFPIGFEVFYENEVPTYRVTYIPTQHERVMFATLEGINGIPLDEVIERLKPYLSYENSYFLASKLSGSGYPGALSNKDLLLITGIMEDEEDTVRYNLRSTTGIKLSVKLESFTTEDFSSLEITGWTHNLAYPMIYGDSGTEYYHYKMLPDDDMIYVRFNKFTPMPEYSILNFGNDILREVRDAGGVEKLVVDLRCNPGGSQHLGFPEFITVLQRLDVEQIYVLIDQDSFSCAIVMATRIKYSIPDAILVGTPAGQPPNFFAGMYDGDYVMPNCGVICRIPTAFYRMMPDYEYDALMPDITVYPTPEDFYLGVDTILEAVKAQ